MCDNSAVEHRHPQGFGGGEPALRGGGAEGGKEGGISSQKCRCKEPHCLEFL